MTRMRRTLQGMGTRGAAVLLLARNPNLSYAQLKDAIMSSVDPLPAFAGKTVTGGRLNVYKALSAAGSSTGVATASASAASLFSVAAISTTRDLVATAEAPLV